MDFSDEIIRLNLVIEEARATNRSLNRRMQAVEGLMVGKLKWMAWERDHYKGQYDRERLRVKMMETGIGREAGFLALKRIRETNKN